MKICEMIESFRSQLFTLKTSLRDDLFLEETSLVHREKVVNEAKILIEELYPVNREIYEPDTDC